MHTSSSRLRRPRTSTRFPYTTLFRSCITIEKKPLPKRLGTIAVACAGTSDLPVAEEAVVTAEIMGNRVERVCDVGVADRKSTRLNSSHSSISYAVFCLKKQIATALNG